MLVTKGTQSFGIDVKIMEDGATSPNFTISNDLTGRMSFKQFGEYVRSTTIQVALRVLKEEQAKGFDKNPIFVTDNRRGKNPADVLPFGKIEIFSKISSQKLILDLYRALVNFSPVSTGQYQDFHAVLVNGRPVASTEIDLKTYLDSKPLKDKDSVKFVNMTPYSGFLERTGVTAQHRGSGNINMVKSKDKRQRSGPKVRKPNGVYFLLYRKFKSVVKANVYIKFDFIPGDQLGLVSEFTGRNGKKMRRTFAKKRGQKYFGYYVYPTITIGIRGGGVT